MRTTRPGLALVWLLGPFGCFTDTNVTDRPLFDNGVNVFEAQVVDGHTGALIGNATITVQVGRHVLTADNDRGFYTVYGIPYGTFRINATAPGYNNFQATRDFQDSNTWASLSEGDPLVYYFNNLIMYPVGTAPADVEVSVYDASSGAAVTGATVAATLDSLTSLVTISDPLAPNVGSAPSTVVTATDAQGKATIAVANLVMGATYMIDVYGALDADGVYMVPISNRSVRIGYDVQEVIVFLSRPQLTPVALLANNEEGDVVSTLVVTFPYAVELCSEPIDHDWYNSTSTHTGVTDTDGDGTVTSPAATTPATATLTVNDTVLTLTYATENNDAADELYLTFTGVQLKPRGAADASCTALASVALRSLTGTPRISAEIHARHIP